MPRTSEADEVQVLRFFETGPIDKVEAVFNIVTEKMRARLHGRENGGSRPEPGATRRQPRRRAEETPVGPQAPGESAV